MQTREILEKLISFATVSHKSNLALIAFCQELLEKNGFDCQRVYDKTKQKSALIAVLNKEAKGGIMLSAHSDVVPISGQNWSYPPFLLTEDKGKLYGRGTADMKGFLASMLNFSNLIAHKKTKEAVYICISYDEEIGCVGVRPMLDVMQQQNIKPRFCLVGEPTSMQIAIGHKGKVMADIEAIGRSGHSALAPKALNAIYLINDFINAFRALQIKIENHGKQDSAYNVPYTTVHMGLINSGSSINIVPDHATARFEIRNIFADNANMILEKLHQAAEEITKIYSANFPEAALKITVKNSYPALNTKEDEPALLEMMHIIQSNARPIKVAYGTEAGLIAQALDCPVLVCGPANMEQGHKADEFITLEQLALCDTMMHNLALSLISSA